MNATNRKGAPLFISARLPFKASALTGHYGNNGQTGRLGSPDLNAFRLAEAEGIDYTVMSYGTPIAWHSASGWWLVGQKFSSTTSRHQSIVRGALRGVEVSA